MRHNPLPLLGVALVSALLASGPAFAAPKDGPGATVDIGPNGRPNPLPYTYRPGSQPVAPDQIRHHMRPGYQPDRMAPDRHPGWSDERRPMPPRWHGERQQNGPRWNDERPVPPMPPRHHYQPDRRGHDMRPMPPARPGDDNGRWNRPGPDPRPDRPYQPQRPNPNDIPFRYHR